VAGPAFVVVGHVTLDRRGDALVPGGSAWYAARALAALGAAPRVVTAAGPDFPPDALAGIPTAVRDAAATTVFENVHGADGRRTQRVLAAAPPLSPADLPPGEAWRRADALLLAPVLDELVPRAFLDAIRAPVVGLGVQGLLRRVGPTGAVTQPRWEPAPDALDGVGIAFLGEDDLVGQGDLVARLAARVAVVVLTHGPRGCEVWAAGRRAEVGVHPSREVDPTGAGDAFAAGFLRAVVGGADPVEAARLGAAAGSISVEGVGGDALGRMGEAFGRARLVPILSPPRPVP
jgi:sugar/nucleoside kinase (ribokinase family)